ncbi:MAG: putative toxin-antitoxin system toxin component, PIN family [Spirochaetes bacterium]|jgi:putative PIN family toxin of toxin-antitoxin system|nr:putative toxin-antitoxin system toxin component, PIN family [Spirochaetota bacterium]
MKIVLDTNVILSALITQGLSSRVLDICIDKHQLFISGWIIDEVLSKLDAKMHASRKEIARVGAFLDSVFIAAVPDGVMPDVCRDKDDNNILFLAQYVGADLLITGDNDLLSLNTHLKTRVITPRHFMENYYKPD